MSLENERREYQYGKLTRAELEPTPFAQFEKWMKQALTAGIQDPTAMSLCTVNSAGRPWQRIVLLKGFDEQGLIFYTNLGSRKAQQMAENSQVSVLFPWLQMDRQVIVAGAAQPIGALESARYFLSRPRESQLAAWASQQSRKLSARQVLEAQLESMRQKFSHGEIPMPDFWGGYRIRPHEWEFWQGGENRLHDRFQYLPGSGSGSWEISRLAP